MLPNPQEVSLYQSKSCVSSYFFLILSCGLLNLIQFSLFSSNSICYCVCGDQTPVSCKL